MEKHRKKAILYLVTASILWSIGGLFIKLVNWNPLAIAGVRSGIAAIVMLLYLELIPK
ncbi:EamA family transporter [Clostridium sp.]|uniref:EamA family transporter n=1 Tax=Clostridium sp. TaxID=1506 RepID=UPI002849F7FF|nr:EamA family transporter [Clostridium sp.]MDR3596072.1 EamA family transporter [Clostridium sp.]